MTAPHSSGVLVLTVPVTSGTYTDTFAGQPHPATAAANNPGSTRISSITVSLLAGFAATAVIELWVLSPTPGADPTNIASYMFGTQVLSAVGAATTTLAMWPGCLIRAKSGGTSGTATVWYSAAT